MTLENHSCDLYRDAKFCAKYLVIIRHFSDILQLAGTIETGRAEEGWLLMIDFSSCQNTEYEMEQCVRAFEQERAPYP